MKPITLKKLRNFNLIMGGLHFVQGVAMLFLATTVIEKNEEFSTVITQNFMAFNTETMILELHSFLFQLRHTSSFLFQRSSMRSMEKIWRWASTSSDGLSIP